MPFAGFAPVVAVALGAAVLAGCQSEAPPTPSPSPSVTASSASPSASAPASPSPSASGDLPAAAREKTEKGAEAFVAYFVQQSARAWTTPDASMIEVLSDPDCESCASLATTASELETKGHRSKADPITLVSVEILVGEDDRQNVAAMIKQHEMDVIDQDGKVVDSDSAGDLQRTFLLYWKEGQWLVGGIA
ncbi:MAG TPA: DUF6318 family protein [Ornithinibacter sp.]|nr:DUF6318 family protein [Ornithinibacter sp.]